MSWAATGQALAGVVIGGGLTLASDYLLESRKERRDVEMHERQRREASTDRRVSFEIETLIRVHDCLSRFARAATKFHLEDVRIAKQSGTAYGSFQIGDGELNEEVRQTNVELSYLTGLVLVDDIRTALSTAQAEFNRLSLIRGSVDDAEGQFQVAGEAGFAALRQVSARIRELYAEAGSAVTSPMGTP